MQRVLDVPHGATLVLVPRAEDADWLNINRPVFAQRELRVVLFCDTETTVALARQAVDFFDWISHRVECPNRPPRFAVAGIRCALAARAPGLMWLGGNLEATFAAARPHGKLHRVSAARPYAEMLAEVREHRGAWIAWTEVNSHFRLRRVRWVLAEARHRTRTILIEPTVSSPGWWPVHARLQDVREARALLEKAGASFPGRLAALNELEPEALTWTCSYLERGISEETLEATLLGAKTPGVELREEPGQQVASQLLRGEATPPLMRAFTPMDLRRRLQEECTTIQQRLEQGESVESTVLAGWTAWVAQPDPDLAFPQPEFAVEVWLRSPHPTQIPWDELTAWATEMADLDAAESWALRAIAEKRPYARAMLAHVRQAQGRHDEAESLIEEVLTNEAQTLGRKYPVPTSIPIILAETLIGRERYPQAEAFLRKALSDLEHDPKDEDQLSGTLRYQLAKVLSHQEKYSETEALLRQSLAISEDSQELTLLQEGMYLDELAKAISGQGRHDEAESLLRQSLSILQSTLGTEHPMLGVSLHNLATSLRYRGKYADAEPLFRQALSIKERTAGVESRSYASSLSGLASTLRGQGKYEEAETAQRQALAIEERTLGHEHPSYVASLHELATILQEKGKYAEAESLFRRVLALQEKLLGPSSQELCVTLSNLGLTLAQQGRPDEGASFIIRALELAQATSGHDNPRTAYFLNILAQLQDASGNQEAPNTARKALDALHRTLGPEHPTTQKVSPRLQAIITKPRQTPGASER
ncbi:tetratricopeptide repeat protein [Archangium violaceum]|uniref:tetratricopeptide repeat protein n=1 Tax=Archangium violaceum TaxID=83451 RepID=UPI0037C02B01